MARKSASYTQRGPLESGEVFRVGRREVTPGFKRKTHELVEKAISLVESEGPGALGLRALARDKSPATVQNYFGTQRGLLAAVAASGFQTLDEKLHISSAALRARAEVHLGFGLQFEGWYATMHSPLVWRAKKRKERVTEVGRLAEVEEQWFCQARDARDSAFERFVDAAMHEGFAADKARNVARMVTALVDGYLFQVREEGEEKDRALGLELIEMAMRGPHASA